MSHAGKCLRLLAAAAFFFAAAASAGEPPPPRFDRVFCWGYPTDETSAQRYAEAGVTDIPVRSRKEFDLAVKYGMTPYTDCFLPVGPHRQVMTPEEEAFSSYINGRDLDPALPRAERSRIIHRRRIEKQHRYGGDSTVDPDTLRCDLPCFISDTDLELTRKRIDELLARAVPGVGGIYLDYIGYTNHRGCYCDGCLAELRSFLAGRGLADTPENRAVFYRDELVRYYNRVIEYIRSRRPDFKIVLHIYPEFRPDPLYGNRVEADFCGQTVAWYFKWPTEKIARHTRYVVEHAKDHHPNAEGIPFLGVNASPNGSLGFKTPAEVEEELRIILAAGGRTLMVCDGPAMIRPGYFEVFRKYCGRKTP